MSYFFLLTVFYATTYKNSGVKVVNHVKHHNTSLSNKTFYKTFLKLCFPLTLAIW